MNNTLQKILIIAAIICCVMLSGSVLVAAINLGTKLLSAGVLFAFQIVFTICGTLLSLAFTLVIASWMFSVISEWVSEIRREHRDAIEKLQKRTPTFVVIAAMVAQLVVVIADKSFGDSPLATVTVTILLTIIFWFGNEFLLSESRARKTVGIVFWVFGVLLLPTAVMLHGNQGLAGLWGKICLIDLSSRIALLLGLVITIAAPFVLKR